MPPAARPRAAVAPAAAPPELTASDSPPPPPVPNGGAPLSTDQLAKLYQGLSSTARGALEGIIKTKGIDGLSKMSETDARSSFSGMPTTVRDEIQAKWDGLSDEQRVALKKLKPDDIKQMATTQAKEIAQASVAPMMKVVERVVRTTEAMVDKIKDALKNSRDYVQKLIARFRGAEEP
ncbi:MAG: hypothetical protein JWM91_1938 [Rhodospirillales bacterium]|nr:hypothetical protein [Rhodospirillales bacterium]